MKEVSGTTYHCLPPVKNSAGGLIMAVIINTQAGPKMGLLRLISMGRECCIENC